MHAPLTATEHEIIDEFRRILRIGRHEIKPNHETLTSNVRNLRMPDRQLPQAIHEIVAIFAGLIDKPFFPHDVDHCAHSPGRNRIGLVAGEIPKALSTKSCGTLRLTTDCHY